MKISWEKEKSTGNQHFLFFPLCFLALPEENLNFLVTFILLISSAFSLEWSKILSFGINLSSIDQHRQKIYTSPTPKKGTSFLYARQRWDVLWDHPWQAGGRASGRRPVLCPEHISKTTLAWVMKFHGWIDLIQGECSAQES